MGLRTIIIDDELDAISALELIIRDYLPELELVASFDDPLIALDLLPDLKPDLVFLDITMPKMSGFELLDSIKNRSFNLIFVTAFDEFALNAFKYSAVDYILKPIDIDQLIASISKITKKGNEVKELNLKYDKLLEYINSNKQQKITVSTRDEVYYLNHDDIIYINADGSYAKIFLNANSPILISKGLKDIESQLINNIFFRVHKSYLININYVNKLLKSDGGSIEMSNGDLIPISKRKRAEFDEKMNKIFSNPEL